MLSSAFVVSGYLLTVLGLPLTYVVGTKWSTELRVVSRTQNGKKKKRRRLDKGDEEHASAATSRFLVLSTLAWVVWGTSFVSALLIMYYYLSRGPHLLMVHLGATFICSLFAEVFMISAFVTFVNPDLSQEHVGELKKETEGKKQQKREKQGTTKTRRRPRSTPYFIVMVLGTFMSILGGILVSLIEFLPDQTSKLVYTFLSAVSILIGVTKTHGLGGWILHRGRRKRTREKFDSNWSFWQPGRGGSVFIVTQFFGWCFFGMSLLGLGWMCKFALAQIASCGVFCLRSVSLPTAAVMITAQLILAGSLSYFQDTEGETGGQKPMATLKGHYESIRTYIQECLTVLLFYCPHFLIIGSALIPYLCLPIVYASSIMMGLFLPLHLLGSIGQPQVTGIRESKAFKSWAGTSFERISNRFLGGVRYICEEESHLDGGKERDQKYIFAYHPHALYPLGVVMFHLLAHFRKYFGSLQPVTLIASVIFRVPIMRDLACLAGCREVTSTSFRRALRDRGSVALVPGGQAELCVAPRAHNETNPEIVLNIRHKGFIKIALETGASVVPVLCFGEIYQLKNGICMPRLQAWTYKQFGFPIPFLPVGRFGMPVPLPMDPKHPITFVVGKAMRVEKIEGMISREQVEKTHAIYYARVVELYEKYKAMAGYENRKLVLEA